MKPLRILVVAHYFAPLQSVGSLRPAAWVRHWRAAGHEVHVITTRKTAADGQLDAGSPAELRGGITEVPYARWLGNFLERRAKRHRSTSTDRSRPFVESRSTIRWIKRKILGNYLDYRLFWFRPAVAAADKLMREGQFDVVVSTAPPFPAHMVAAALKARHPRLVWVADYRDLWSGSHLFPGIGLVRWLERWQERLTLSAADMVSTVSAPLAGYLENLLRRPVTVIPNGFERDELARPAEGERSKAGARAERVVVHTGTIYESGHDVHTLLRALEVLAQRRSVPPDRLRVRFYGESRVLQAALGRFPHASAHVEHMGFVTRPEALAVQGRADSLLFFDWADRNSDASEGILSGKLFEYLASGAEILVVGGGENSLAGALVTSCGAGTCYGTDHLRLADALERIAERGGSWIEPRWDMLAPYDRRKTSLALLEAISSLTVARREARTQ